MNTYIVKRKGENDIEVEGDKIYVEYTSNHIIIEKNSDTVLIAPSDCLVYKSHSK